MTGREFLFKACDGKLTDEDLSEEGNAFTADYYQRPSGELYGPFLTDYEAALANGLPSSYHVTDTWENYDRFEPYASAAYARWKAAPRREHKTLASLDKELFQELRTRLEPFGFRGRASDRTFRRKTPLGYHGIAYTDAKYVVELHSSLYASVRIDEVEHLLNACRNYMTARTAKETATVHYSVRQLRDRQRQAWWDIRLDADVGAVADEMAEHLRELALPFFDRFSSKEAVYAVFSKDDEEAMGYSGTRESRAEAAIALALLLGGPAEASRMIEVKRSYLRTIRQDAVNLALFEEFVARFQRNNELS
jgi:hypothetical protein